MDKSIVVIGAALVAGVFGGIVGASMVGGRAEASAPEPAQAKEFEGVSEGMNFDKAINDAVTKAWAELSKSPTWPKADGMLRFKIIEMTGERGGFAGFNRLKIKIAASQ